MDLECDICTERFDGADRLPKVLPCGHTACLQCLRRLPLSSCPSCRQDFNGPPEGLITNFLALKLLEGVRLDSTSLWCSECRTAPSPRCCSEDHDVMPVRRALKRQLQGALPQAAEQLQGLQDQCREEQALPALTLLTSESWDVTLRGGGRELTGTLRDTEEPLTKALCFLLAARVALTEDRAGARDPPPAAAPAPPAAPLAARDLQPDTHHYHLPLEMDVRHITLGGPGDKQQEKAAALRDAPGVTRLVGVYCDKDYAWSLQLLQLAGPTLDWLRVESVEEAHLLAVHAMPRLRRLHVEGSYDEPPVLPVLPALPPGHAGLQWLCVWYLPRATTQSLLRAHGGTLEELRLHVGTAGSKKWPWNCSDLHSLLEQSGLRALRRIVLRRNDKRHKPAACSQQRAEVRRVLPRAEVLCYECDNVRAEEL